ncbi:MAG: penicillin-binding protein 2 [Synergistales bacterium]|nr:penicillin-binding protein 2 [Synergistales bacterium]
MDGRLVAWLFVMLACIVLLVAALFSFQIARADRYVRLAANNRLRLIRVPPQRGQVYDRNNLALAQNVRTYDIRGYPLNLRSPDRLQRIAGFFQDHGVFLEADRLEGRIKRQYWTPYRAVTLVSNLTMPQIAGMLADPDFPRFLFPYPVWRRTYPFGDLTAHVTGYVGEITQQELQSQGQEGTYRGGDDIGKTGIERYYEDALRGVPGEEAIEVDAGGRRLKRVAYKEPAAGEDIHLTLDLGAQRLAARLLEDRKGAIVALDVRTGAVHVLYSAPPFDVNPLTWGIVESEWKDLVVAEDRPMLNRGVGGTYPPASPFKAISAVAGLAEGAVTRHTRFHCPGYLKIGNRTFKCWQSWGHGSENVIEAIRDSCDVYFYELGLRTGIDALHSWAERFGLGRRTGIDLPGEKAGNAPGRSWKQKQIGESWYPGDTANYVIGQGYLLVTPLQMACVYAAIANGGTLVQPYLGRRHQKEGVPVGIPEQVLSAVQEGMIEVVEPGGTGERAGQFGVSVAGKTGTAQNPHGEDHAWFVGYAPVEDPRYVAVALVEGGGHGSRAASPLVGKMLAYLCRGR